MKRILIAIFFIFSILKGESLFTIKDPVFAPENEYNFIDKKQEAALNDKSGFYYRLSTQYIPPYLINLETDEYYLLKEKKSNKLSLKRLCKSNLIDIGEKTVFITLKTPNDEEERTVFIYSPYINGKKVCALNKEILFLPVKRYKKPLVLEVSLYETNEPVFEGWEKDPELIKSVRFKEKRKLKTVKFELDPLKIKTNTVYIPLYFEKEGSQEELDAGFLTIILHPVASKITETDFTDYGYPNLSKLSLESLPALKNPLDKNRNLKEDAFILSKAAKNLDPNILESCNYVMNFIKEYELGIYDLNALFWLIFKDNPYFQESLCYKEHEKYLVYSKRVPQPKDFVIPVLKPEIPAKEIPKITLASNYNEVTVKFEANKTIKEFEDNETKVLNLPNEPLAYNSEKENNETGESGSLAEETSAQALSIVHTEPKKPSNEKITLKEEKNEHPPKKIAKKFNYDDIPFSGISSKERNRIFKILSSSLRAKNKKRFFGRIFPKNEVSFTLLNDIPALTIEGLKPKETFIIDRNTLAQILSPLNKEKLGCWFLLRSVKIKNGKKVSIGEELSRDDYEMMALYKDKNKEIGNQGYLIIYVNYKKIGKNRFVISSIAFEKPTEKLYEILKDRTSKKSRCYKFLKKFKKEVSLK